MILIEQLRLLRSQILTPGLGKEAFRTWEDVKSDLSPEQRLAILTAWNVYLRTENDSPIRKTIRGIIEETRRHTNNTAHWGSHNH